MEILLIRHGRTEGNKERRFMGGRTDEPVCEDGKQELRARRYERPELIFSSPMRRCLQTAEIIFGEKSPEIVENFRECDFGILEGKNHRELSGNPEYEAFLKSGGSAPFPGGESVEDFGLRCMEGMKEAIRRGVLQNASSIGCVVHGGVIMSILSAIFPESGYYDWNVGNGEGYLLDIEETAWEKGRYHGTVISGIDHRIYT